MILFSICFYLFVDIGFFFELGVSLPDSSQAESDDNKDSLVPETVTETETDKQGISLPRFGLRVFSWFSLVSFINTFVFAASVPPPEKKIEKPLERKKPTKPAKLLVDLADKETCSDKQRYEFITKSWFLCRDIYYI